MTSRAVKFNFRRPFGHTLLFPPHPITCPTEAGYNPIITVSTMGTYQLFNQNYVKLHCCNYGKAKSNFRLPY